MIINLNKLTICPKCGSREYSIDYAADGIKTCKECKNKMETIMLKTIEPGLDVPDNCSFCGKVGEQDDLLPIALDEVAVFKCKGCGQLDGFLILENYDEESLPFDNPYLDSGLYSRKEVRIAEKEGRTILSASTSKEIARAIKKLQKSPREKCKKLLHCLVQKKNEQLQEAKVTPEIASIACAKVEYFINKKGELTDKQLLNLFLTAIYVTKNETAGTEDSHLPRLTERMMHQIFGIDRKTIRKLKRLFIRDRSC